MASSLHPIVVLVSQDSIYGYIATTVYGIPCNAATYAYNPLSCPRYVILTCFMKMVWTHAQPRIGTMSEISMRISFLSSPQPLPSSSCTRHSPPPPPLQWQGFQQAQEMGGTVGAQENQGRAVQEGGAWQEWQGGGAAGEGGGGAGQDGAGAKSEVRAKCLHGKAAGAISTQAEISYTNMVERLVNIGTQVSLPCWCKISQPGFFICPSCFAMDILLHLIPGLQRITAIDNSVQCDRGRRVAPWGACQSATSPPAHCSPLHCLAFLDLSVDTAATWPLLCTPCTPPPCHDTLTLIGAAAEHCCPRKAGVWGRGGRVLQAMLVSKLYTCSAF